MTQGLSITEKMSTQTYQNSTPNKCIIISAICMAVFSFIIFIIFWFTNIFQDAILSNLIIKNDSSSDDWFSRPPVRAIYKIYIFNYTNVEDFKNGTAKKLRVQETGPYIYRETLTRINQIFHPNGSVSFQEKRSFQWEGGRPDDEMIVVPNIPWLAFYSYTKNVIFDQILSSWEIVHEFQALSANEYLWGYDSYIFNVAKRFLSLPFDKFGVLAYKKNVSPDVITIDTGENDINQLGVIQNVNGQNKTKQFWDDEKCDRIRGTEGYIFPPGTFNGPNASVDVYSKEMCRTLTLRYAGMGKAFGIPTLIFKSPPDTFTMSEEKDYCYCPKETSDNLSTRQCPIAGLFSAKTCSYNIPFLASYPHFYGGHKNLTDEIDGLNPQAKLHESSIEIHPRLGTLITGNSRLQINIQIGEDTKLKILSHLQGTRILPLVWVDVHIDQIPEKIITLFKHAYYTAAISEYTMQWGSIVIFIMSIFTIIYIVRK